ncbi:13998_t:CDS:2, partial [Dentiscutata heterogama]
DDFEHIEEYHPENICNNISAKEDYMNIIENDIEDHQTSIQGNFKNGYPLDAENYQVAAQDNFGSFEENYLLNIEGCPDTTVQYISTKEITIKEGDSFSSWEEAKSYLENYTKSLEFSLCLIEPIFHEVFVVMKKYLLAHIQSIQKQQINRALLYHAKIIPKESINLIQEDSDQLDCDYGFLEDHLDRPQLSLHFLLDY